MTSSFSSNGLEIIISKSLLSKLCNDGEIHYPNEFGGLLIGKYSRDLTKLYISDTILPEKSSGKPTIFKREIIDMEIKLNNLYDNKKLLYVGEWHTHPNGVTQFSQMDLNAMKNIESCKTVKINNPVLLIIGIKNGKFNKLNFYYINNGELISYEQN